MTIFVQLCQLSHGCMGCCGHGFNSKEKIKEAIRKNTLEFDQIKEKTEEDLLAFRNRYYVMDLLNGVCRNLIEQNGRLLCPLHPAQNNGKDLRVGHCDAHHLCLTAKEFLMWDKEKQDRFVKFIEKEDLDNVEYSMQMDNGELLKRFERV